MKPEAWIQWVFRPLVVAAMIGSLVVSIVSLISLIFPAWSGTYLVVLCTLAALEGYYAYRVLHLDVTRMSDPAKWRIVELVMFFLVVRATSLISDSRPLAPGQISILDTKTAASYIVLLLCWLGATNTSRDLMYVGEAPDRDFRYVPPIERLISRFFFGGGLLLITSGLSRIGYHNLFSLSRASVSGVVLNVLVYFVLGVIMLAQIHYSSLHNRWRANGMRIAEGLSGRWVRYSVTFLCLVALLVIFLPTSYTVGLLDILQSVLTVISAIGLLFWYVLAFPFAWIISHLFHLSPAVHSTHSPRLKPPHPPTSHPYNWMGLLRSIVFWGVVLACFVYMVRNYLQRHALVRRLGAFLSPLAHHLLRLWLALWRRAQGYVRTAAERLPRLRPPRPNPSATVVRRFFRLGTASPREQVMYYYLSVLRRADRRGFPRRGGQTPYEYSTSLAPALPEAEPDVERLTQAFVEARYSARTIEPVQASWARTSWERVKAALRGRPSPGNSEAKPRG